MISQQILTDFNQVFTVVNRDELPTHHF